MKFRYLTYVPASPSAQMGTLAACKKDAPNKGNEKDWSQEAAEGDIGLGEEWRYARKLEVEPIPGKGEDDPMSDV